MEQKAWPWRKHSNKAKTLKALKEETEKGKELEKSLRYLTEKLTSLLNESDVKDSLMVKQEKVAEEALAGWEKAEANAVSLKKELDDALQQTVVAEERLQGLDNSLKECMKQLHVVQEEREAMINEFAVRTLKEEEMVRISEERVVEVKKVVAQLVEENGSLNAVLEDREKIIKNMRYDKVREEENYKVILAKLDSTEKQNSSLKYEVYMLGKELQIRNEEKDFNLNSVKAAHKQHLSSVKRITELEEECNRLRVMLRKRLPGPAALAKMKNEVELLDGNASETQTRKSSIKKNSVAGSTNAVSWPSGKKDFQVDRMRVVEEENKILKEELIKKNTDLQSSRLLCAHTASKLSQAEKKLEQLSKTASIHADAGNIVTSDFHGSNSETGCNDDILSSAESWASALVAELEHFKSFKSVRTSDTLDINSVDDFAELEKLVLTTSSKQHEGSSEPKNPVSSGSSDLNSGTLSSHTSLDCFSRWLKDTFGAILQKHNIGQEDINGILKDSLTSLTDASFLGSRDSPNLIHASSKIFSKDSHCVSFKAVDCKSLSQCNPTAQHTKENLEKAIYELVEVVKVLKEKSLIGEISDKVIPGKDDDRLSQKHPDEPSEFVNWAFKWKSLQLKEVLECFLQACSGLLNGSIDVTKFILDVTSSLRWMVDHATFSQETESFDEKQRCDMSESCLGMDEAYPDAEIDKSYIPEEVKLTIEVPLLTPDSRTFQDRNSGCEKINELKEREDSMNTESQSKCFNASQDVVKSNQRTLTLQSEFERLKEAKILMCQRTKEQRHSNCLINVYDRRDTVRSFPSLKEALEDCSNCPDDSESACANKQVQLESCTKEENPDHMVYQDQNPRTNWEISVASEKLAECQETILNIEKQLKALTASGNAPSIKKVATSAVTRKRSQCLGDHLLLEDNHSPMAVVYTDASEKMCSNMLLIPRTRTSTDKAMQVKSPKISSGIIGVIDKHKTADLGSSALAIVPGKQRPRVSLWRRLLLRRSKESYKKMARA